ncbi:lycopene cyclase domain-containing protein [Oscillatoria sp. FACHB-1407]|uniref:lycopene cyclase domain-containing protein n=1 Tax=Oscillatoria sp. FACHB-1407 TaxID=2692847 RepID=UPI0016873787|nr:lycopene cyclase domain-containing protein [Oscillatoria sp. FACHB-1407]MBD2460326.1 lycopene cyclase domain-containing protein [Oscillatoria sp. FACHB-1407]
MSYFTFHFIFIFPPILLLLWLQQRPLAGVGGWRARFGIPLLSLVAFIYTTPWDNYLVWRKIWGYGSDRVVGTIGYVPVEEYLFFVLQCVLTGLWLYWLLKRAPESAQPASLKMSAPKGFRLLLTVLGIGISAAGFVMLRSPSTLYLGLVLAWAVPILTLQWAIGAGVLWKMRRIWFISTAVPTVYLWVADRLAIGNDIWHISETYTTGLQLFGLPIEEATFFLVTNLLITQGLILFLLLEIPHTVSHLVAEVGKTIGSSSIESRN